MAATKIQPFTGQIPKLSALLLPESGAQIAVNTKLMSGEIRPWRKALAGFAGSNPIVAAAKTLHRLYGSGGESAFLSWATDVNVVGSPLTDASDFRAYYTGNTTPRKTNWALAIQGTGTYPYDYLEMGVPAPSAPPTLTVTNGSGTAETRAYLVTYLSTFGALTEESAPCAPVTCTINPTGGHVVINGFAAPPAGKYNITGRRIYRSLEGTSDYGWVADLAIATTTYTDAALTGSATSLLGSLYWTPPPAGLQGLVTMPNGMVAGFVDNEVWFCEPYFLHAWPSIYMLTVDYPVVGLAVFGSTLVVLTERIPYLITGSHPAAMSQEAIQMPEPCIAKRSIAANESGVLYVSPNGIVAIGQGQQGVVSEYAYSRDEWQAQSPSSLFGALFGRRYMLFNAAQPAASRTALVWPLGEQMGVTFLDSPATAFHVDRKTGDTFIAAETDGKLYQLDADDENFMAFDWKSKKFVLPQPENYACLQVNADFAYMGDTAAIAAAVAAAEAYNAALVVSGSIYAGEVNGSAFNAFRFNGNQFKPIPRAADVRNLTASVYADGALVWSGPLTSIEPLRLPGGSMNYTWELELTGNVPCRSLAVGTSIAELKRAT